MDGLRGLKRGDFINYLCIYRDACYNEEVSLGPEHCICKLKTAFSYIITRLSQTFNKYLIVKYVLFPYNEALILATHQKGVILKLEPNKIFFFGICLGTKKLKVGFLF